MGDRILLETSEDVNNGEGITFRDYVILRNDTVVQEDGDNLLLETGFNLKIEDEEAIPLLQVNYLLLMDLTLLTMILW